MKSLLLTRVQQLTDRPCLILDGGMGTSLNNLGMKENEVWLTSTRLSERHVREHVKRAHLKFLQSGADIITTNTYELGELDYLPKSSNVWAESNDTRLANVMDNWAKWTCEGIGLAKEAIDDYVAMNANFATSHAERPLLAVSIGTFATSIMNRPETANREHAAGEETVFKRIKGYGFDSHTIQTYFNTRLSDKVLEHATEAGASILAFETVGDLMEVQVICDVLHEKSDKLGEMAVWVSLTCLTATSVDTGDTFAACVEVLAGCPLVAGVGINCTEPKLVKPLLETLKRVLEERGASDKLIVVYPNSGETYLCRELEEGETEHWKKGESYEEWVFEDAAVEWISCGANVVGGCCRIYARQINKLAAKIKMNEKDFIKND